MIAWLINNIISIIVYAIIIGIYGQYMYKRGYKKGWVDYEMRTIHCTSDID